MPIAARYEDLLLQIVDRIRRYVSIFGGEGTCFLSLDPDQLPPSPGDMICIVAPLNGTFGQDYFTGGGKEQMQVDSGFVVKIHSPLVLDEVQREADFLTDQSLGVISVARQVLNILSEWAPTNEDGDQIIRDLVSPSSFSFTRSNERIGAVELMFRLNFDWNVTSGDEES